jgi:two-component system CheB/CheR fusion protein
MPKRIGSASAPLFPIVGIGASAGGLEAIELFLKNVPPDSGMAYIVVQHLDPNHESIMPELIQRVTSMTVVQAEDRARVMPNCVYAIPPNKDISILRGVLHLFDFPSPRGLRMPIDFFFRTLADDRAELAVGVILSGTGTDGTLGLRAIKGKNGIAFVQDPATAKFDGMPRSAIDDGLADIVASPEALPRLIAEHHIHASSLAAPGEGLAEDPQGAMEKIIIILRSRTGNDFSLYKKSTLHRRVERRMGIHRIASIAAYQRFLQENPQELDILFKELLIGVTSFFRDPEAWDALRDKVLRPLLESAPRDAPLRAWVAGCSTGEEAYSLAIAYKELLDAEPLRSQRGMQIFATDLDKDAIEKARQGFYPANAAADLTPERLQRYFLPENGGFRVRKDIREMVIFAPQNLVMDPPFTKLDIACCRNLLIYLSAELQKKLLPMLHYALNPDGFLFLGNSESIGTFSDLFSILDAKARLYRRVDAADGKKGFDIHAAPLARRVVPAGQSQAKAESSVQRLADDVLLQNFAPAAALVNVEGDIVYISGRTGKYLEPAAGKADWNILAMARKGLRLKLEGAFLKALAKPDRVILRGIEVEGGSAYVDLTAQCLQEPEALRGMVMLAFAEASPPESPKPPASASPSDSRANGLESEIEEAREELRDLREGIQVSQEELRSANEELQSTNEELQSTIEELMTSKEEMQSLNEELQTVNNELQAKVDQLVGSSNDMKNLLDSTGIATLFLDEKLLVRRFTTQTASLTRLISADVGRPITDIASDLLYPDLAADAAGVLRTLAPIEREVLSRDGKWFCVRVMPYRTGETAVDGVVITYSDISRMKLLEAELAESSRRLAESAAMGSAK